MSQGVAIFLGVVLFFTVVPAAIGIGLAIRNARRKRTVQSTEPVRKDEQLNVTTEAGRMHYARQKVAIDQALADETRAEVESELSYARAAADAAERAHRDAVLSERIASRYAATVVPPATSPVTAPATQPVTPPNA